MVRLFAIGLIMLGALYGIHKESAYAVGPEGPVANGPQQCQDIHVDVIGGIRVCAEVTGVTVTNNEVAWSNVWFSVALTQDAEPIYTFWNWELFRCESNSPYYELPGPPYYAWVSPPLPGGYVNSAVQYGWLARSGGGYIANECAGEYAAGVLQVNWSIAVNTGHGAGTVIDQGEISWWLVTLLPGV